jgi:hypothetical protein
MIPMNEFIVRNLHPTKQFLEALSTIPQRSPKEIEESEAAKEPISPEQKENALSGAHHLLFLNKDAVIELLQQRETKQDSEDLEKPLKEFNRLIEMNVSDWKDIAEMIVGSTPIIRAFCTSIQSAEIAQSLITIFEAYHVTIPVLEDLIRVECEEARNNPTMLLRGNGTAFKMLKGYVEIICLSYLQETLGMMVKFVCNNPDGYEIDPARCPPDMTEQEKEQNIQRLLEAFTEFWNQIIHSAANIPIQIRVLCRQLFDQVSIHSPERRYNITGLAKCPR